MTDQNRKQMAKADKKKGGGLPRLLRWQHFRSRGRGSRSREGCGAARSRRFWADNSPAWIALRPQAIKRPIWSVIWRDKY